MPLVNKPAENRHRTLEHNLTLDRDLTRPPILLVWAEKPQRKQGEEAQVDKPFYQEYREVHSEWTTQWI